MAERLRARCGSAESAGVQGELEDVEADQNDLPSLADVGDHLALGSQTLREADRTQVGIQMLPLPCALGIVGSLTAAVETDCFRGVAGRVGRVAEHVRYGARLAGRAGGGNGGGCTGVGRVARGGVSRECGSATSGHGDFSTFPLTQRSDGRAGSIVARSQFFEDWQYSLGA
jgi:hypothetical protein